MPHPKVIDSYKQKIVLRKTNHEPQFSLISFNMFLLG